MRNINKYGLSRHIPNPVAREVRQRCGFGCVNCGSAIYQYHHFDPPFEEARRHNPDGITLLCGEHHNAVDKQLLSNETVKELNKNPKCLEEGFSHWSFDISRRQSPVIILGDITFVDTPNMLEVFGKPLLKLEAPESPGSPFRISAVFYDESGKEIARIVRNEWHGLVNDWDIKTIGQRFTICHALGQVALVIRSDPPDRLIVERLDMFYKGFRITGREGEPTTAFLHGEMWFKTAGNMTFVGNAHGIVIEF